VVGNVPAPCSPSGLAFDKNGFLYIADAPDIFKLNPVPSGAGPGPSATLFVAGLVPGANGLAFDRHGNLWTGDGTTGQGRVWKITPAGIVTEEFRIQPMAATNLEIGISFGSGQSFGSNVTSVGRDARTLPPGQIDTARAATNTAGSQPLVANGLAFNSDGDLFIADTARGAIWKVRFKRNGELEDHQTGCDVVFTENTLCLTNIYVAHPLLEGTDGIALDKAGNIWNSANERNAIVVVTTDKKVIEIFRNNPDGTTHLRNSGPLEFPTSPFLLANKFCTANSDGNRRDNSPAIGGEIGNAGQPLGKISCMDKNLIIEGLPLPVR
jgi:sugar lactone lactonase YvrE